MLAALALKWRWRERQRAAGQPTDRPNLVTGANVQVCWEKFCRYFDVEARLVPVEGDRLHLTGDRGRPALRREHHRRGRRPGLDLRRQLRAGQGDRRRPWISCSGTPGWTSRSTSTPPQAGSWRRSCSPTWNGTSAFPGCSRSTPPGTSTGWSTPGVGWVVWRNEEALPQDLIFDVNYLGGHMPTFTLNFSRPGSEVVAQYFMFTSLGFEGYRRVQQRSSDIAQYLAAAIAKMGPYRLISDGSELPVFAFALDPGVTNYTVFDVSDRLRERGWLVPAYTFPENRQDLAVLRVVVRAGMTYDMADQLLTDLRTRTAALESLDQPLPAGASGTTQVFAH